MIVGVCFCVYIRGHESRPFHIRKFDAVAHALPNCEAIISIVVAVACAESEKRFAAAGTYYTIPLRRTINLQIKWM